MLDVDGLSCIIEGFLLKVPLTRVQVMRLVKMKEMAKDESMVCEDHNAVTR
jgi:hypothetical protein